MFYTYLRSLVALLLWAVNGPTRYENLDKLPAPETNYVLAAPHKTLWDPVYLAFAARPKRFIIMAKQELFKNRILGWWIRMCGAFPVDRENPGQEVLKYPVRMLRKSDFSLMLFPSGTRHSSELKGGVAVIAKTAKVPIVPAFYQGPTTIGGLLKGQPVTIRIGDSLDISDIKRLNSEGLAEVSTRLQASFDQLEAEIQPQERSLLTWLLLPIRLVVLLFVLVLILLTVLFSWIASFVYQPNIDVK